MLKTVFLVDVDDTLLDNDRFGADLSDRLQLWFGKSECDRYWQLFSVRREQLGMADYLGTLQLFRAGLDDEPKLLGMSNYLLDYPFRDLLYPESLAVIAHLSTLGTPVVLSDGDIVFQPRKIERAGIAAAVEGRVLVYVHKEKMLDHVERRYPASHYVMVDDKPNLLSTMKASLGDRLTTVFVRQGHYALAAGTHLGDPPPDRMIDSIGGLLTLTSSDFRGRS